jgi:hypothetical protein
MKKIYVKPLVMKRENLAKIAAGACVISHCAPV